MNLRAAFPSAEFKVDHVIGRDDPTMPRALLYVGACGVNTTVGVPLASQQGRVYVLGSAR